MQHQWIAAYFVSVVATLLPVHTPSHAVQRFPPPTKAPVAAPWRPPVWLVALCQNEARRLLGNGQRRFDFGFVAIKQTRYFLFVQCVAKGELLMKVTIVFGPFRRAQPTAGS